MKNNRIYTVFVALFVGIFWAIFLLYNRRGGYLNANDFIALLTAFVLVLVILLLVIKKQKRN
jgi:hypothetical protein